MNSRLSLRLSFIREHTPLSKHIYDIGCDHGDLGLSFTSCPEVESIHFVDASEEVINRLNLKIKEADIPNGVFIEKKEVQQLKITSKPSTLIMCGFGGQQLIDGIENLRSQTHTESFYVLSPHRDYLKLREYLSLQKFHCLHDLVIEERGLYYPLLVVAAKEGSPVHPYGDNLWQTHSGRHFRDHLLAKLKKHQNPRDLNFFRYLESFTA